MFQCNYLFILYNYIVIVGRGLVLHIFWWQFLYFCFNLDSPCTTCNYFVCLKKRRKKNFRQYKHFDKFEYEKRYGVKLLRFCIPARDYSFCVTIINQIQVCAKYSRLFMIIILFIFCINTWPPDICYPQKLTGAVELENVITQRKHIHASRNSMLTIHDQIYFVYNKTKKRNSVKRGVRPAARCLTCHLQHVETPRGPTHFVRVPEREIIIAKVISLWLF